MVVEWVDHSLDLARKVENKLEVAEKAHAEVDKMLKETLAAQKNTELALKSFEKQTVEALEAQRKAENKMALTVVELKQTKKQLKAKEMEMC